MLVGETLDIIPKHRMKNILSELIIPCKYWNDIPKINNNEFWSLSIFPNFWIRSVILYSHENIIFQLISIYSYMQ